MDIKNLTQKYITKCDEVITKNDNGEAEKLQKKIIAAFENLINNIEHNLDYGWKSLYDGAGNTANYVENIEKLKCKLEMFLASGCEYINSQKNKERSEININNNNNNININLDVMFKKTKEIIKNDESLSEEEIKEILEKINEIESVSISGEPRNKKWFKLRGVMSWVGTKGVVVATSILNLITAILKAQ